MNVSGDKSPEKGAVRHESEPWHVRGGWPGLRGPGRRLNEAGPGLRRIICARRKPAQAQLPGPASVNSPVFASLIPVILCICAGFLAARLALVSRALRLLEERGLVALLAQGSTPRKKILCSITPAGRQLHDEVMPVARQHQAAALMALTQEEREVMYRALLKLRGYCQGSQADPATEGGPATADGEA